LDLNDLVGPLDRKVAAREDGEGLGRITAGENTPDDVT
jgi:hypothetical protein